MKIYVVVSEDRNESPEDRTREVVGVVTCLYSALREVERIKACGWWYEIEIWEDNKNISSYFMYAQDLKWEHNSGEVNEVLEKYEEEVPL